MRMSPPAETLRDGTSGTDTRSDRLVDAERPPAWALGIYGGSFDPIHVGHLHVASAARNALRLDHVLFVPAHRSPHKGSPAATIADRVAMVQIAISDESFVNAATAGRSASAGTPAAPSRVRQWTRRHQETPPAGDSVGANSRPNEVPWASVWTIEADAAPPSYTVHTVRTARERWPDATIGLIVGADTLQDFASWRNPDEILALATLVVVGRHGQELVIPPSVAPLLEDAPGRIALISADPPAVASREIRDAYARGDGGGDALPRSVDAYIRKRGIYGAGYALGLERERPARRVMRSESRHAEDQRHDGTSCGESTARSACSV